MYPMLEHPEIGHIQRTGYPSWMDLDDEDSWAEEDEDMDGYTNEDALYEERRERELFGYE
jgi:hypothetical protein